jgi:hypothetical protein
MFGDPRKTAGTCAARQTSSAPAALGTACRGTAPDTSPDELSMLADQVIGFRKSSRALRVQCVLEQARKFAAGHCITTALAVAVSVAAILFLIR